MDSTDDVVVVGGGIAGLAAARTVAEAGRSVTLLEARERLGGRILTVHPDGADGPVELGAEFVHGRPPELLQLLEDAHIELQEVGGTDYCFKDGSLTDCERMESSFHLLDGLAEIAAREGDMSFDDYLARHRPSPEQATQPRLFVEGFNAADAGRIGIASLAFQQQAEDSIQGERAYRVIDGYESLVGYLARGVERAGARIRLLSAVTRLVWDTEGVMVHTEKGSVRARYAVVTAPLGVLQARRIVFEPEPVETLQAADRMAAGTAQRVAMVFRNAFWQHRAPGLGFLFTDSTLPAVWWTPHPRRSPVLVGWVGGPRALDARLSEGRGLLDTALDSLARIFSQEAGVLAGELLSWHLHDWQKDPWSLGAYSYAPVGALDASEAMAVPVGETLFFAGEHTDTTGHWGTVHGALRSGLRAAAQLLASGAD